MTTEISERDLGPKLTPRRDPHSRSEPAWAEPDKWYAQLATFHAAAALFVTDDTGRVLLVKPNYRDHWAIPGGYVDQHESPTPPPRGSSARNSD